MSKKNSKKRGKENNNCIKINGILFASIIALLIPAFYLFGFRFYEGILNVYGINIYSMELDTTEIYIYAYYAISYVIAEYLNGFSNIIIWITIFFIVSFLISKGSLIIKILLVEKYPIFNRENSIHPITESVIRYFTYTSFFLITLGFLGILWISIPTWGYEKGKISQSKEIKKYHLYGCHTDESNWSSCIQILDENNTKIYEGLLVANKGDKVIIYDKNGSQIFRLKENQILYRENLLNIKRQDLVD